MQRAGWYPEGVNPAEKQISFTDKDRKERAKLGAEPFSDADLDLIFSPDNLKAVRSKHTYRAALVSVLSGARVNEVCQMETLVFCVVAGMPCINFADLGAEQSVKSNSSKRLVPVPQALIELGFLDYVKEQENKKKLRIFPKLKTDGLNGPGDAVSKSFNRYVKRLGIKGRTGRKTFHSFRDPVIVRMQDKKDDVVTQAAITGHGLNGAHFVNYSREAKLQEIKEAMDMALDYPFFPRLMAEWEAEKLGKLLSWPSEANRRHRGA